MSKNKDEHNVLVIEASSPEDLKINLESIFKITRLESRFVSLAISGPQVLVCPFHYKDVRVKDLKNLLRLEAVELLSLPANEIEVDFQIFRSTEDLICGVFLCLPKGLLKKYVDVLDKAKLIPIKVTAHIFASIETFLRQQAVMDQKLCFLDFSKENLIHLAVFNNEQCELIREIPYEHIDEARQEVIQSLRSVCAQSSLKNFDTIYCIGELAGLDDLRQEIEKRFSTHTESHPALDISTALGVEDNFFSLNLMRNFTFSLKERKQIFMGTHLVLALFLAVCVLMASKTIMNSRKIQKLESMYSSKDVNYAVNLKRHLALQSNVQ